MSAALEELRRLVPPPEDPPLAAHWAAARDNFGFDLPQDYRELIDLYGAGLFNEELWVFAPGHPSESWDVLRLTDNEMWGLRYVREHGERLPYEPAPVERQPDPLGKNRLRRHLLLEHHRCRGAGGLAGRALGAPHARVASLRLHGDRVPRGPVQRTNRGAVLRRLVALGRAGVLAP
jgi:hypothetical protein